MLIRHFLEKEFLTAGFTEKKISTDAIQSLVSYAWPGNIRELENLIRYLMVTTEDEYIDLVNIPLHVRDRNPILDTYTNSGTASPGTASSGIAFPEKTNGEANDFIMNLCSMTWPQLEKEYVVSLLKKNNCNITWAAKASGINRSTFASRMRKLDISRQRQGD
ncbi:AAA-type ATPase lid domain-containing protein [Desulfobacula phenolica]|uniref:Regulatory protein, Fis family n=1 Tax=Desulfobacula phenolica TaxID=90732 RepID=A0A1H2II87_9BACT|nr:helix-turn-helix domain-containing protein [Desulfobacula phenolica]SDU43877.1 regulatory protein, Fis family [Desulfobacula phenolica]